MGLLVEGLPLTWSASEPFRARVKADGISQFLAIYHSCKDMRTPALKWGDEVEYILVRSDPSSRHSALVTSAPALLSELQREENSQPAGSSVPVLWRPEYATWMIEGTPGVPYRCYAADLVNVEKNMVMRRAAVQALLAPGESALTLTTFPMMGMPGYTFPETKAGGPIARSLFTSDEVINPHPRFGTLTRNIRARRKRKVDVRVPVFVDEKTPQKLPLLTGGDRQIKELTGSAVDIDTKEAIETGDAAFVTLEEAKHMTTGRDIVMDSSAFGMGCCCLQVTLQANDMSEGRYLYDQLAVMAPIMLALTAATPALRGVLADTDVRWNVIGASMDDRTEEEVCSGAVPKSRYSSIDCYISERPSAKAATYNDLPVPIDTGTYQRLVEGGVDHLLAQHVAHLYIREPLCIYKDLMEQDNETSADHFENIQSTNWNTVRFKPPPPGSDIGWRTEFRSMEVALTDFENAAFCVFTVLLSRVILAFDLNLYIPMSLVDENMETAHARGAVDKNSFFFRKNILSSCSGSGFVCDCGHIHHSSIVGSEAKVVDINKLCPDSSDSDDSEADSFDRLSLAEIFNGKSLCVDGVPTGFAFPGLIPLVRGYVAALNIDCETRSRLDTYLDFMSERASGKLCTTASFLRDFIRRHADYKNDSMVSDTICYDLIDFCTRITNGEARADELLGRFDAERFGNVDSSEAMMERMHRELKGAEGGMLQGSSLPKGALHETLQKLATDAMVAPCGGC